MKRLINFSLILLITFSFNDFTKAQYASSSELRAKVKDVNASFEAYSPEKVRFSFLSSGNFRIIDNSGTVRSQASKVIFNFKDEQTGIWVICKNNDACFEKGAETYNFLLVDPVSKKPLPKLMKETVVRLNQILEGFGEKESVEEISDEDLYYEAMSDLFGGSEENKSERSNKESIDNSLTFIKSITNEMLLEINKSDMHKRIMAIISDSFEKENINDKTNGRLYGIVYLKDENYSYSVFFGLNSSDNEVLFQIIGNIKNPSIYSYLKSISANGENWKSSNSSDLLIMKNEQKNMKTLELDGRFELSKKIN